MALTEASAHWLCAIVIFITGFLGVCCAHCLREFDSFPTLNTFTGALMLSAGFIHLLPDAAEILVEFEFPWAYFCCSASFLFLFLLDRHFESQYNLKYEVYDGVEMASPKQTEETQIEKEESLETKPRHGHSHGFEAAPDSAFGCISFFIGISAHSVLEGLGLGSASGDDIWTVFLAIVAHKGLAGFALGASFVRTRLRFENVICWGLLFSLITPVFIMFGFYVNQEEETIVDGIFLALASGSFLYVAIIEVLVVEFQTDVTLPKVISCLFGWSVFASLAIWV